MKRWSWLVGLLVVVAGLIFVATRRAAPPEVPFAKAKRETLVSLLTTNGKTEPLEWAPLHAERAGRVSRLLVSRGQTVAAGAAMAVMEDNESQAAIATAQARLEQARAEVANLQRGGRAVELAESAAAVQRLKIDRTTLQRELSSLERLVEKNAATRVELDAAKDRAAQLDAQISAQEARRAALVGQGDVTVAQARVRDAEAALAQAKLRSEQATLRAPRGGVVYDLPAREGGWLEAGALVARVGDLSRLKVTVYVDEPDLGRARKGLPVTLTWDAMPGREWQGVVDMVPSQVIGLGSRQVGEVVTIAENPQRDLPPGANVNARIRSQVVEGALSIPKAALRRNQSELGVFVLEGGRPETGRLAWRAVKVGSSSDYRAEIQSGLKEGDAVALPSERTLAAGLEVTAVYP
jgi:HlyD family secretion protein